jgi:hypothetical protein
MRSHSPSPARRSRSRSLAHALLATAAACFAVALLAACGSSHSGGTAADPAGVVPASAAVYAGATVRPSGDQRQAALQAGFRLTRRPDAYQRLAAALDTPGSPALDYTRDLSSWLGPRAGVFLSSLRSAGTLLPVAETLVSSGAAAPAFPFRAGVVDGAFVLDTRDLARARSFVARQAQRGGAHAASFDGVGYQVTAAGIAFAVLDSFVVIGTESGLHGVIETAHGAPALTHATAYSQLQAAARPEAIGHVFVAQPGSAPAAAGAGADVGGLLVALSGGRPLNASLVPSASALTLDVDLLGPSGVGAGGALGSAGEGATALGELPGESWLALGLGHVGASIAADVAVLRGVVAFGTSNSSSAGSALNLGTLLNGLLTPLSALGADTPQARRDYASWMGSGGVFAAGAGLLELKAGVVFESTDAAASRAAVGKLGAQLSHSGGSVSPASIPGTEAAVSVRTPGLPVALIAAAGHDAAGHAKFVLGLGEASVAAALNPSSKLAGSSTVSAASGTLGEGIQPNLIFQTPTLLALLESLGLTEDPTLARVLPYLRNTTGVVAGGRDLGNGVQRVRLALQLRPG